MWAREAVPRPEKALLVEKSLQHMLFQSHFRAGLCGMVCCTGFGLHEEGLGLHEEGLGLHEEGLGLHEEGLGLHEGQGCTKKR